jgi:hypothetical protein
MLLFMGLPGRAGNKKSAVHGRTLHYVDYYFEGNLLD